MKICNNCGLAIGDEDTVIIAHGKIVRHLHCPRRSIGNDTTVKLRKKDPGTELRDLLAEDNKRRMENLQNVPEAPLKPTGFPPDISFWEEHEKALNKMHETIKDAEHCKTPIGKPAWDRMPWAELAEVRAVMDHGDSKYAPDNWKKIPAAEKALFAAAMRHLVAHQTGEYSDPEDGLSHLAHATASLLYLMWHTKFRGAAKV